MDITVNFENLKKFEKY